MATPILSVITENCAIYVDDISMSDLAVSDPPLYARNMWQLLRPALAKFNHPAEMQSYIFGTETNPNLVEPEFDSTTSITTEVIYSPTIDINLGEDYAGYDLCAVRYRYTDRTGNVVLVPYSSTYDSETGNIVVYNPSELPAGSVFEIDFYKDGYFVNTLTPQMRDIMGIAFQYVWQDRFNTDWLSIVSKIEDKSFQEQNRANKMNADGMRLREIAIKLAGAMRKFEQDVYYKNTFPGGTGLNLK